VTRADDAAAEDEHGGHGTPVRTSSSPSTKAMPTTASMLGRKESAFSITISGEGAVSRRQLRPPQVEGPGGHGPMATFPAGSATLVA
jgi:hypothetical protein